MKNQIIKIKTKLKPAKFALFHPSFVSLSIFFLSSFRAKKKKFFYPLIQNIKTILIILSILLLKDKSFKIFINLWRDTPNYLFFINISWDTQNSPSKDLNHWPILLWSPQKNFFPVNTFESLRGSTLFSSPEKNFSFSSV